MIETCLYQYMPHSHVESCFFRLVLDRSILTAVDLHILKWPPPLCSAVGLKDPLMMLLTRFWKFNVAQMSPGAMLLMGGLPFGITVWGPVLAMPGGAEMFWTIHRQGWCFEDSKTDGLFCLVLVQRTSNVWKSIIYLRKLCHALTHTSPFTILIYIVSFGKKFSDVMRHQTKR